MFKEPPKDFGREAIESEEKDIRARKRGKKILSVIALLLISGTIVYALREHMNFSDFSAANKGKSSTDKNKNELTLPVDNVTIIKKWDMPRDLKEISGLSYYDDQRLACVQDEAGKIYIYNIEKNAIEKEIGFGSPGDYEGVAIVGKAAWILRADGVLFEVNDVNAAKPSVKEYRTHLTVAQDCEGLCYDQLHERLLITVKGKDPNSSDYKGIYAFDLKTHVMAKEPAVRIDLQDEAFNGTATGKKKKKAATIMPSAITIHPVSRDLYITDGPKSRLLVTDKAGTIKKLLQLDTKLFAQPEGITFNKQGELYISNEGPKDPGNILKVMIDAK